MKNYGLENILSQVRRDERLKSTRTKYDFNLAYNRICISGDRGQILTVIKTEHPIFYDFKGNGGRRKKDDFDFENESIDDLEEKEMRRGQTKNKINETIHDLADDNFTRYDKFVTLVPPVQMLDLKIANDYTQKFLRRLRDTENNGNKFKYLFGIHFEQENRECIHYHGLWDLYYIEQEKLLEYWGKGKGSVYIQQVRDIKSFGDYMIEYVGKEIDDARFAGQKAYLCSKGLKRRGWKYATDEEVKAEIEQRELTDKNITYEEEHETEYYGLRIKTTYNSERWRDDKI